MMPSTTLSLSTEPPETVTEPIHIFRRFLSDLKVPAATNVEQDDRQESSILLMADFLFGATTLDGAVAILDNAESLITRIVDGPNKRQMYFCRSSSSQHHHYHHSSNQRPASEVPSSYLCIIPKSEDRYPIHYCSCRSFLELSRSTATSAPRLCKHLLALYLLPYLDSQPCALVETSSDSEFSKLVIHRLGIR